MNEPLDFPVLVYFPYSSLPAGIDTGVLAFRNGAWSSTLLLPSPSAIRDSTTIPAAALDTGYLYKKPNNNSLFWKTTTSELDLTLNSGGVLGPDTSTVNALTRWNATDGTLLSNSTVTLDSSGIFSSLNSASTVSATTSISTINYKLNSIDFIKYYSSQPIAIGYSVYNGTSDLDNAINNIVIGKNSMTSITTGYNNIAMGTQTLNALTTGLDNVVIGSSAGLSVNTGISNVLIGSAAGSSITSGTSNVAIGTNANTFQNVSDTISIGNSASYRNAGTRNICLGSSSLGNSLSGNDNICIGHNANIRSISSNNVIAIGSYAYGIAPSSFTASNAIIIGNNTSPNTAGTVGNQLIFGHNLLIASAGTYISETLIRSSVGTTTTRICQFDTTTREVTYSSTNTLGATSILGNSGGVIKLSPLSVNGTVSTINGDGTLTAASDRRLKTDEILITDALNVCLQLQPKYFKFLSDLKVKKAGFIAQDVEEVLPEAVDGKKYEYYPELDPEGNPLIDQDGNIILSDKPRYRGLDQTAILAMVVGAIKELHEMINSISVH